MKLLWKGTYLQLDVEGDVFDATIAALYQEYTETQRFGEALVTAKADPSLLRRAELLTAGKAAGLAAAISRMTRERELAAA